MEKEYNNDEVNLFITEVTPPFSIQNICKLGIDYGKGAGVWFSDGIMSSIFYEINSEFKTIHNMEIILANEGIIDEETILETCFEELKCRSECDEWIKFLHREKNNLDSLYFNEEKELGENYDSNLIDEFIRKLSLEDREKNYSQNNEKILSNLPLCKNCENIYLNRDDFKNKTIKKNNKVFIFKKGATLLISVRLGLESISKEYFDSIRHIYKIPYNLGIIGGKKNSALYFIGEYQDKLIYLDPHVNQKAVKDAFILQTESEFHTYSPKYYYQTGVGNISPAFTTGFYFRSLKEYKNLLRSFNEHLSFNHPVFKFRHSSEENYLKKASTKKVKLENINEEDDFCIIDYEDESIDDKEENI
jgi:hypothetical protein